MPIFYSPGHSVSVQRPVAVASFRLLQPRFCQHIFAIPDAANQALTGTPVHALPSSVRTIRSRHRKTRLHPRC